MPVGFAQVYLNNSTDYSEGFLQNEPSPLHTTTIAEHATRKLVDEFEYLRQNGMTRLCVCACAMSRVARLPRIASRGAAVDISRLHHVRLHD